MSVRTSSVATAIGAVLCVFTMGTLSAQQAEQASSPMIGKWKLRGVPPVTGTREYEDRGCGVVVSTRQGVSRDGREYFSQYVVKYDGKEYPRLVRGSNAVNTVANPPPPPDTVSFTLREDGRVASRGTTRVSKDRKVLTVTTWRADRPESKSEEIYDRQ
jgi:hypothetical protein